MTSSTDRILETIDAGLGTSPSQASSPINAEQCGRQGCKRAAVDDRSFCAPCLAWLRFESDDDPLKRDGGSGEPEPEDDYHAWVAAMCGYA